MFDPFEQLTLENLNSDMYDSIKQFLYGLNNNELIVFSLLMFFLLPVGMAGLVWFLFGWGVRRRGQEPNW
ncbi:MAG: hypothetical protein TE42_02535 [Candidatus Synechococcus spongiarum SP3]|uniref:Uncharacterized protein n=1 Tax=Candidatus Synechococcus spongiarum SP3 TaxID=1604020 RepID=A0A0G2HM07_9SYNE|nr:MAG: hypothetical protein TE42_02535 [Candidatus Synechococcus spongiarum SP3]